MFNECFWNKSLKLETRNSKLTIEIMPTKIINVEQLSVSFDERPVLQNISFSVYENQVTVILGRSGCGKSTVLKHLIGLFPLQAGEIKVMDTDLRNIDEGAQEKLALQMGVLFQNGALLNSLTVGENVAIPLEQHTQLSDSFVEDIVRLKLSLVELAHARHLYPAQISGGMRKRAALARSIALDPPLLFCDEPSAGLDPVTLSALDQLILRLKNQLGMTIVLVTHEVASIRRLADRIVFLHNGTVLFEGSLEDAMNSAISEIRDFFQKSTK